MQERQYGCDADQDMQDMQGMQDSERPGSGGGASFSGGYTEAELLARVQCSVGELRAALRSRHALCLGELRLGLAGVQLECTQLPLHQLSETGCRCGCGAGPRLPALNLLSMI